MSTTIKKNIYIYCHDENVILKYFWLVVWHGILFNVKNVPWFKEGWKNWSSQQKQTTALARNPGAHRQLAVPTLLKPWGQLLLAQAAKEVQGVYLLSLWEISQRPGAGVWEHRRCLTASVRPSLDLLKESLFGTVLKGKKHAGQI